MLWLPMAREAMSSVAAPPLSVLDPRLVEPSRNVTVPVGVPPPGLAAETVTVNVTDWPNTDGLTEERRPAVVGARATVTDALAARAVFVLSPAVTFWLPLVRNVTVKACDP